MPTITPATEKALTALENSGLLEPSEILSATNLRQGYDTITVRVNTLNHVFFHVEHKTGVLHFPHSPLVDEIEADDATDWIVPDPSGADKEHFLSLADEAIRAMRIRCVTGV